MTWHTDVRKQVLDALLRCETDWNAVDVVAVRDEPHVPDVATPFGVKVMGDEIKFCQYDTH
jgi:hypothetical protein